MKLLTKTSLYLLYFTTVAFIISGFVFYYSIRSVIYKQINESLITEKNIIQEQIEHTDTIPDFNTNFNHLIEVKIFEHQLKHKQTIKDTLLSTSDEEDIPYRKLFFTGSTKHKKGYSISISHPLSEKKELLENISILLLILFFILILIFGIINYWLSKRLWVPFYRSLAEINRFDINSKTLPSFSKSNIQEFNRLNQVLESMSKKILDDYINLKEFNENASHEIQTPLSIIRTKLELLLQYENLNPEQLNLLESINNAITRLSKLNQGLLIISKIDNQQFALSEELDIQSIFRKILLENDEVIKLKNITLKTDFESPIIIKINPILAEILATNLVSNAIRHNIENGHISIRTDSRTLIITNSGNALTTSTSSLFNRFSKNSANKDSIGLGLSIVQRITSYYGFSITYSYNNLAHEIKIVF